MKDGVSPVNYSDSDSVKTIIVHLRYIISDGKYTYNLVPCDKLYLPNLGRNVPNSSIISGHGFYLKVTIDFDDVCLFTTSLNS